MRCGQRSGSVFSAELPEGDLTDKGGSQNVRTADAVLHALFLKQGEEALGDGTGHIDLTDESFEFFAVPRTLDEAFGVLEALLLGPVLVGDGLSVRLDLGFLCAHVCAGKFLALLGIEPRLSV